VYLEFNAFILYFHTDREIFYSDFHCSSPLCKQLPDVC
jgi:hypothetical protein